MECMLREWKMEDKTALVEIFNNKNVIKNLSDLPFPYTEKNAEDFINSTLSADKNNNISRAITLNDKAIGSIGVFRREGIHRRTAELGYCLNEKYWGKGYMTNAVKQITHEVFEKTDIVRIFAEPYAYNIGSSRVLEKAGFVYEGILKSNAIKDEKILDTKMYALVKKLS